MMSVCTLTENIQVLSKNVLRIIQGFAYPKEIIVKKKKNLEWCLIDWIKIVVFFQVCIQLVSVALYISL